MRSNTLFFCWDGRYLKNIIVKYMETGEHDALLPVISTILQFTPEELERINQRRKGNNSLWGSVCPPFLLLSILTHSLTHSLMGVCATGVG
jgi:hypothetical protein